jgi:hypothetical protein
VREKGGERMKEAERMDVCVCLSVFMCVWNRERVCV